MMRSVEFNLHCSNLWLQDMVFQICRFLMDEVLFDLAFIWLTYFNQGSTLSLFTWSTYFNQGSASDVVEMGKQYSAVETTLLKGQRPRL